MKKKLKIVIASLGLAFTGQVYVVGPTRIV